MSYYFSKTLSCSFEQAVDAVTKKLAEQGFGVLTRINVQETLKKKIGVDFPRYEILGACNPKFAHRALSVEDKIGTMLPCNVIVHEKDGKIEVAAIDPVASMAAVDNEQLHGLAQEVRRALEGVVSGLG
jgi:uncharacterized protein (DUF302 family)